MCSVAQKLIQLYVSLKIDNQFGHDYRPGEPLYAIVNRDQKQRRVPSSTDNYSPNENIHFWNGAEFGIYLLLFSFLTLRMYKSQAEYGEGLNV